MQKLAPNNEQKIAIEHGSGPLLIVAGAGTGKTRVITERIAHLVMTEQAKVNEILALTFTEKAAAEMEERVDQLLPYGYVDTWISTFHSFCDKLLKRHALDVGLNPSYKLLDETACWLLVRKNLERFNLDYYRPLGNPVRFIHALLKHFSRCKDEGILPAQYLKYAEEIKLNQDSADFVKELDLEEIENPEAMIKQEILRIEEIANAYHVYQQLLIENNALDFADLIIYTIDLFKQRPLILNHYRKQFKYLLVDEYQDTNFIQNELIKLLAAPNNNLTVVGDDDQSIYRFRGSSIENIMQFKSDFPAAKEVVLNTNYRSAQVILDASYKFIKQNDPHRLEVTLKINKKLQAANDINGLVSHLHFDTAANEAIGVVNKILDLKEKDSELNWSDFAILVRANDTAEVFTQSLAKAKVPHQFLALKGLYNKAVIIDLINYFKLLDNYHENSAVFRVLNFPHWQIDVFEVAKIVQYATRKTLSLYETLRQAAVVPGISENTVTITNKIVNLIQQHTALTKTKKASELMIDFLYHSGYLEYLKNLNNKEGFDAIAYLEQFYKKILTAETAGEIDRLTDFMALYGMEIEAGEVGSLRLNLDDGPDMVKVMTVHSAKGLEFKYVFVVGLVDRKFPTDQRHDAIRLPEKLLREKLPNLDFHIEEERRLFYVAMTRAKVGLFLTSADDYGGARQKKLSRFLVELGYSKPETVIKYTDQVTAPISATPMEEKELAVPQKFSFSNLSMYERCPYQYYLAQVLGLPTPSKGALVFGDVIHRTLKEFVEQSSALTGMAQVSLFSTPVTEARILSYVDLLKIYERNWLDDWYSDRKVRDEYYELGRQILKNFQADFEQEKPKVRLLEQPFKTEFGSFRITGRIDRIDDIEGGIEIIDYKTGEGKDLNTLDKQQLMLYQIVAEKELKLTPIKLTYHYLNDNKKVSFLGNEKQKEKLIEDWMERMEKIQRREFKASPGEFVCQFCDFKGMCEFRKL